MQVLIIAAFGAWFANISGIPQMVSQFLFLMGKFKQVTPEFKRPYRLKPFDCEMCLTFWLYLFTHFEQPILNNLFMSGVCSLIAMIITKLYNKI